MIVQPRGALVVAAAVAFGLAWAPWWDLSWTDALGVQTLAVTGAQGTGGMAQILPVAALGGILATLTLRCVGRRVIAVVLGGLFVSMAALGFDARNPDPARLAATESPQLWRRAPRLPRHSSPWRIWSRESWVWQRRSGSVGNPATGGRNARLPRQGWKIRCHLGKLWMRGMTPHWTDGTENGHE